MRGFEPNAGASSDSAIAVRVISPSRMRSISAMSAVLPGLVNAHTHLELSWLRGRIPETGDFPGWIRSVITLSREARPSDAEIARAIAEAIDEATKIRHCCC